MKKLLALVLMCATLSMHSADDDANAVQVAKKSYIRLCLKFGSGIAVIKIARCNCDYEKCKLSTRLTGNHTFSAQTPGKYLFSV